MKNNKSLVSQDEQKHLEILSLIEKDGMITQQEIADHLGVAIGLVNSFVKRMVRRGYIRIKRVPKRRYLYMLTPKGVSEKGRLTIRFIQDSLKLYRDYRHKCKEIFKELVLDGVSKVYLIGTGDLAEIAYLSLQEIGIQVSDVFDPGLEKAGKRFFGKNVNPLCDLPEGGVVVMADLNYPGNGEDSNLGNHDQWIDLRV
jgi:DNA-binding MarR family transcriptional regulator